MRNSRLPRDTRSRVIVVLWLVAGLLLALWVIGLLAR